MSTSVATFRNRQILGSMISTKFAELEKQRLAYIETFNKILKDAEAPVDDPIGKIEILLEVRGILVDQDYKAAKEALEYLREDNTEWLGEKLKKQKMSTVEVKRAMKEFLLTSDLLEEDSRAALREYLGDPDIIEEIKATLSVHLRSIDTWTWPEEGSIISFRRHINGKCRTFSDPNLLNAIMLHHLRMILQAQFKSFENKTRRAEQLGIKPNRGQCIESATQKSHQHNFYLAQLPSTIDAAVGYEKINDKEYPPHDYYDRDPKKGCYSLDQDTLLSLIVTDSLPHAAILHILKFLGVPEVWLNLFERFLKESIRLKVDPTREVRAPKYGAATGYTLSTLFEEAVLFIMDYMSKY
ncbi:hypothetical protein M422DRAFT_245780 [Sphaerobolus stellatus SS14]|nr:hypothetical protein M422DRAFT_245780 [Sphaerobolus stellatus SS14]